MSELENPFEKVKKEVERELNQSEVAQEQRDILGNAKEILSILDTSNSDDLHPSKVYDAIERLEQFEFEDMKEKADNYEGKFLSNFRTAAKARSPS